MSSSENNYDSSLQPAPTPASTTGAPYHVLVPHQQQAGHSSLLPNDPQALQAALQHALNTAALSAAISGITFPNACGEGVAALEHCCKKKTRSHDPETCQGIAKCSAPGWLYQVHPLQLLQSHPQQGRSEVKCQEITSDDIANDVDTLSAESSENDLCFLSKPRQAPRQHALTAVLLVL
jgi:hypothetical protein